MRKCSATACKCAQSCNCNKRQTALRRNACCLACNRRRTAANGSARIRRTAAALCYGAYGAITLCNRNRNRQYGAIARHACALQSIALRQCPAYGNLYGTASLCQLLQCCAMLLQSLRQSLLAIKRQSIMLAAKRRTIAAALRPCASINGNHANLAIRAIVQCMRNNATARNKRSIGAIAAALCSAARARKYGNALRQSNCNSRAINLACNNNIMLAICVIIIAAAMLANNIWQLQ